MLEEAEAEANKNHWEGGVPAPGPDGKGDVRASSPEEAKLASELWHSNTLEELIKHMNEDARRAKREARRQKWPRTPVGVANLPRVNTQNTGQPIQVERAGKTKRDKLAGSSKARQRTMQQKHKAVEQNDVQYEYLKQVLHAKAVADVSSILSCEEPVTAKPLCSPFISQFNHRPVSQAEIDIGHLQAKLWSGKFWKRNTVIDVSSETDTHT